ncbi:MAG: ROK family protein [Thermoguttaceae bacterium]
MPSTTKRQVTLREAKRPCFVGLDLGGTNIKIGVVDDLGRTIQGSYMTIKTEVAKGPEDASRRMGEAILESIRRAGLTPARIAGVGLGSPGTMDIPAGKLVKPANLHGWEYFPLRDRVSHHCGLRITFANDATAAAYGEFWVGSGKDFYSMILLTLGTGIGCGIIIGELLLDGQHSHGGEFGHTIIDSRDDARVCGCGQPGHFEAYASATAVIKRTREALQSGRRSSLNQALRQGAELTPLLVAQHANAGDKLSLEIIRQTARYLAIGAVNLMHTIDPDAILFGGAMTFGGKRTRLGRQFLQWIKQEIHQRAYEVPAQKTMIDFAALGGDAGYLGAAGIARLEYRRSHPA